MEPKYLAEEVIVQPLLIIWQGEPGSLGIQNQIQHEPLFLNGAKIQSFSRQNRASGSCLAARRARSGSALMRDQNLGVPLTVYPWYL